MHNAEEKFKNLQLQSSDTDILSQKSGLMYPGRLGDEMSIHRRAGSAQSWSKYGKTQSEYLGQLMREKRLESLKEQTYYQDIYKMWMQCENITAIITSLGMLIVVTYHIIAIHRLIDYCNETSQTKCQKELLFDRYNEIGA